MKRLQLTPDIYEGLSNYLFLTGGNHDVVSYLNGSRQPDPASVSAFHDNQSQRAKFCQQRNIHYSMWVFPDKLYALRNLVPDLGVLKSLYLSSFLEHHTGKTIQPLNYPIDLLEGREEFFTKGDTHYSPLGEINLMRNILDTIETGAGTEFYNIASPCLNTSLKWAGDLAKKLTPRPTEVLLTSERPLMGILQTKNGVPGNNGTLILMESMRSRTNQTLLIFGDSFFQRMLDHFAYMYRRIIFCRTQFFHYELVETLRPDVILGGAAERYLASHAPDSHRPHFLAYSLLAGRNMQPDPEFTLLFRKYFDQKALVRYNSAEGVV